MNEPKGFVRPAPESTKPRLPDASAGLLRSMPGCELADCASNARNVPSIRQEIPLPAAFTHHAYHPAQLANLSDQFGRPVSLLMPSRDCTRAQPVQAAIADLCIDCA